MENITIKSSSRVSLEQHLTVLTAENPIVLRVEITADLGDIPPEYHEIFINVLSAKYLNTVSFGDNPFSECKAPPKKKWYQIWKN